MIRLLSTTTLLLGCLAAAPAAQVQAFSFSGERKLTQVMLFSNEDGGFDVHGVVAVHYGAPQWRDEYVARVESTKAGTRARLGKDFWTTLDTSVPLQAGDATLEAGTYYLAVEKADEGALRLIALDADEMRAKNYHPGQSGTIQGGTAIPLELEKDLDVRQELAIDLEFDSADPKEMHMVVRWGPFRATAKLHAKLGDGAAPASPGQGK